MDFDDQTKALRLTQFSVDRASEAIFWIDSKANIVYVNDSACRTLGYSRDELLRMSVHDIDPWFPVDVWSNHWDKTRIEGLSVIESKHVTKTGRVLVVELAINHLEFDGAEYHCVFSRNITARKAMEARLRASNERFRALIQGLPVGVMSVDSDFRVIEWNAWAEEITGYSEHDILGRCCTEVLNCDARGSYCVLKSAMVGGQIIGPVDIHIYNKKGLAVPVRVRAALLHDHEGELVGGVETFQDISYLKALEKERENILAMLVHDMKSPLVSIQGLTRRLAEKMDVLPPDKQKKYLDIVTEEAGRIETMISDFLDFSKHQDGQMHLHLSPMDVVRELEDIVDTFTPRYTQARVSLEIIKDTAPPFLRADAPRLRRVINNLLENALRHSPAGTKVTIRTVLTAKELQIRVTDQGPGVPKENLPYLFDPFYRGQSGQNYKGQGLGLAGVSAIVKGHGGRVFVSNRPDCGATFTVALPNSLIA